MDSTANLLAKITNFIKIALKKIYENNKLTLRRKYMINCRSKKKSSDIPAGLPVNARVFNDLQRYWQEFKPILIKAMNEEFNVFQDGELSKKLLARYFSAEVLEHDELLLQKLYEHPYLEPVAQFLTMQKHMTENSYQLSPEGRAICNSPTSKAAIGPEIPQWLMALISPVNGYCLFLHWIGNVRRESGSQQEYQSETITFAEREELMNEICTLAERSGLWVHGIGLNNRILLETDLCVESDCRNLATIMACSWYRKNADPCYLAYLQILDVCALCELYAEHELRFCMMFRETFFEFLSAKDEAGDTNRPSDSNGEKTTIF
jgi:hypothetical protein